MMKLAIPARQGPRPLTVPAVPHLQLDQYPPIQIIIQLIEQCLALPDVIERPSKIAELGTHALSLERNIGRGSIEAFIIDREFAHIHPLPQGSVHLALPPDSCEAVIDQGWGEFHPLTYSGLIPPTIIMVYAPRNLEELNVVFEFVQMSYRFARGILV